MKGKHREAPKEKRHSFQIEWFERMDTAVSWRIQEPDFESPFKPQYDDIQLALLAKSKDALKRLYSIKCLCGGYEILLIKNLASFTVTTDHPCLTGIKAEDLKQYLNSLGLIEQAAASMDEIQRLIREQIKLKPKSSIVHGENLLEKIQKEQAAKEEEKNRSQPASKSTGNVRTIRR